MDDMKNLGYIIGAGIIGVLLGNAIGSSSATGDATTKRLDELSQEVATLGERVAGLSDIRSETEGLGSAIDGLGGRLDEVQSSAQSLGDRVAGLDEAVSGLRSDVEATGESLSGFAVELGTVITAIEDMQERIATAPATAPAPEAGAEAEAAAEDAAEPAEESPADRLAAEIGEDGLVLQVGQTGMVQEQGVFLSRISENAAHLVLVGDGRATAEMNGSPVELDNGCTVDFAGAAEGKAYLSVTCGG
jgi:outer membrane murein-binding lipoprotein Lpp